MITGGHNPDRLPFRSVVPVKNAWLAEKLIQRMMEIKRPLGLRVRHMPDVVKRVMQLETRNAIAMTTVYNVLRDAGMVRRV